MAQIHKCGVCEGQFATETDYNNHNCSVTGHRPTEQEHLIKSTTPQAASISEAALNRGAEQA